MLGAVAQRAEVAGREEARARVGGLGAVDAVELSRVAYRLVHLEHHLLGVDHDGHQAGRARVGAQQCGGLLGDARRLALERQRFDVLPAGLGARAAVGARVAADLRDAVAYCHRVDAAAALHRLLLDRGAIGGDEQLLLLLGADRRSRHLHVLVPERGLRPQAVLDLVGERDLERVLLVRGAVLAACRLERRQLPPVAARCGLGERAGPSGSRARGLDTQLVVAGKAPRAADEHAYPQPLGLDVVEPVDPAVAGRDRLRAPDDDSRVRVRRPCGESRGHRLFAQLPHIRECIGAGLRMEGVATMARARWWRNW